MIHAILQVVWVAAHHGLRKTSRPREEKVALWQLVHELTNQLGNPGAPGS